MLVFSYESNNQYRSNSCESLKHMLTDLELMKKHVRALYTCDAQSRLLRVNEPDNTAIPAARLFLGRTSAGNVWRFRADLSKELCEKLSVLCANEIPLNEGEDYKQPLRHFEDYLRLLEPHPPGQIVSNNIAYQFITDTEPLNPVVVVTENNRQVLHGGFENLTEELPAWQPFVALIKENKAVAVCRSARITAEAHEAGVETLPEFRGNSYAQDVVSVWARLVRKIDAIPLYSTNWENTASQAVARKLGLKCYGVIFSVA